MESVASATVFEGEQCTQLPKTTKCVGCALAMMAIMPLMAALYYAGAPVGVTGVRHYAAPSTRQHTAVRPSTSLGALRPGPRASAPAHDVRPEAPPRPTSAPAPDRTPEPLQVPELGLLAGSSLSLLHLSLPAALALVAGALGLAALFARLTRRPPSPLALVTAAPYGSPLPPRAAPAFPTVYRMQRQDLRGLPGVAGSAGAGAGAGRRGDAAGEARFQRAVQFQSLVQELLRETVRTGPAGARRTIQATRAVLETSREFLQSGAQDKPEVVLRKLFERLGSTYIKLGQFIASSPSLFPEEYVREFQKCLDSTPPVPWSTIRNTIERDLGRPIAEVFEFVDPKPLATASIAQVHAARLRPGGQEVVVKVLKPGVADVLDVDLTFLTSAAKVLEFLNPRFSRVSLVDVLSDIRKSMLEEVDFTKEAQNMKDFELYLKSQGIASATSPFVYTTASSKKVMTMERLKGAPLVDLKSIREITSEDPEAVLINALNVWLGSVLLAPSFHADVHAGNLLVLPDGRVGFIDFGIVGRISPVTFVSVEKFLQSIQLQNYDMMAKALVTMGATEYDRSENSKVSEIDMVEFAADLKELFEGLFNLDPQYVVRGRTDQATGQTILNATVEFDPDEVNNILLDLVKVTEKHGLRLPREFVLLVKQILYFDRYVQALAPDLQVLNDDRIELAQDAR